MVKRTQPQKDYVSSMEIQADSKQSDLMLPQLGCDWLEAGHQLAVVFVVATWGSSPRPVGSIMLVRDDMRIEGSVSGGCIEGAVIEASLDAIQSGIGQHLNFGVADETAWDVGLSCGGSIDVLITPVSESGMPAPLLKSMAEAVTSRQPLQLSASLTSTSVIMDEEPTVIKSGLDATLTNYIHLQEPRLQLILIGAVHIAQYLVPMAQSCGFNVTVIDPRGVFANPERFVDVDVKESWPSDILPQMILDNRTAFVTLTHDPKIDDDALLIALRNPVFYLSCLGSRRTHEKRYSRLQEHISDDILQKIYAPAGLNIGGRSPAEIAVSIMAEMIGAWRAPKRDAS